MAKISAIPSGPQVESRLTGSTAARTMTELSDKINLNATIERIGEVRANFDNVTSEGKRIGGSISGRAEVVAERASERAGEIQDSVRNGISGVQAKNSQVVSNKTAIFMARSQPNAVESGKGDKIDVEA